MAVFAPATIPARDRNGTVLGEAVWKFYYRNSLTPADTDLGDTVAASAQGDFDNITLDPAIDYRAALFSADGVEICDIDTVTDNLFSAAVKQAMTEAEVIIPGATWTFYLEGGTTPTPVYADADLTVKLGNVVSADAAGRFPVLYYNDAVSTKAVLADADGTVLATLDPITTSSMLLYLDPTALQQIEASADFDGTAGSGFDGSFGATPSDPTRTTAKPACRLLVPEKQTIVDTLLVGVIAMANYNDSLLNNLGLDKVTVHYEGSTVDIIAPSFQTFDDINGNPVTYFGWWCEIAHNGIDGPTQLYFEAVPKDGTMQNRVIGPYQMYQLAARYDAELTIAATPAEITGSRYKTIAAAKAWCRANGKHAPRLTITESGTYIPESSGAVWHKHGRWVLEASVPATLQTQANPNFQEGYAYNFQADDEFEIRGSNITIDTVYSVEWSNANYSDGFGRQVRGWFNGCNIINSGGRYYLWRKGAKELTAEFFRNGAWFTECAFTAMRAVFGNAPLARGNTLSDMWGDVCNNTLCVVGNTLDILDQSEYREEVPAMTVTYTGSETTATIERIGYYYYTLRYGSNVDTFTFDDSSAGYVADTNYTVANLAAWINGKTGWSATVLDSTRSLAYLSTTGTLGSGFYATNAKNVTVNLVTMMDVHGDFYQVADSGTLENVVVWGNKCTNIEAQNQFAAGNSKDVFFVNNAFFNYVYSIGGNSQTNGVHNHVVMAHNSMPTQGQKFRADITYAPDSYCLFANNTHIDIAWVGTVDADLTVANNHIDAGETSPSGSTGTTIGGDYSTNYVDPENGDFTPAGTLASNLAVPVVKYDINGVARGATAYKGAVA